MCSTKYLQVLINKCSQTNTITIYLPEADGSSDEGQGKVSKDGDERDVSNSEQADEDGPEGDPGIPWVLPVNQRVHHVRAQPHSSLPKHI